MASRGSLTCITIIELGLIQHAKEFTVMQPGLGMAPMDADRDSTNKASLSWIGGLGEGGG